LQYCDARLRSEERAGTPRSLAVFGAFEAGMDFGLTEWLGLRGGVFWVPPVENLNLIVPQLGLHAEFLSFEGPAARQRPRG
jgi:hypothetical protein